MGINDLSAKEIALLAVFVGIQISENTTPAELVKLAGFFVLLSDTLANIAAEDDGEPVVPTTP